MIALDGTDNKSRLGANAILGVSRWRWPRRRPTRAACRSIAMSAAFQRACPAGADDEHHQWRRTCRQPDRLPGIHDHAGRRAERWREAVRWGAEIFHTLKKGLQEKGRPQHQCRRRGRLCAEPEKHPRGARLHHESIEKAGFKPGDEVALALDCAATEFFKDGKYEIEGEGKSLDPSTHGELPRRAVPPTIRSSRSRTAWRGRLGRLEGADRPDRQDKCPAGRRRPVRHQSRACHGHQDGLANSMLVKVNQIGSLTETLDAVEIAHARGYTAVMSHRSGETEDSTIADLAVATNCGQIKTGSLARSDRLAKYNQLIRIEEELGRSRNFTADGLILALQTSQMG
jgi:enolase